MTDYSEYAGADGFPMDLPIPSSVLTRTSLESTKFGDAVPESVILEIVNNIILHSCINQDKL